MRDPNEPSIKYGSELHVSVERAREAADKFFQDEFVTDSTDAIVELQKLKATSAQKAAHTAKQDMIKSAAAWRSILETGNLMQHLPTPETKATVNEGVRLFLSQWMATFDQEPMKPAPYTLAEYAEAFKQVGQAIKETFEPHMQALTQVFNTIAGNLKSAGWDSYFADPRADVSVMARRPRQAGKTFRTTKIDPMILVPGIMPGDRLAKGRDGRMHPARGNEEVFGTVAHIDPATGYATVVL